MNTKDLFLGRWACFDANETLGEAGDLDQGSEALLALRRLDMRIRLHETAGNHQARVRARVMPAIELIPDETCCHCYSLRSRLDYVQDFSS